MNASVAAAPNAALLAQVLQQMRTPPQTPVGATADLVAAALDSFGQKAAGQGAAGAATPAQTLRTPTALASDLLAEALLQRRHGSSAPSVNPSPSMGEGLSTPFPSPSPGVPAPSAPGGTASAVPAAPSPAAGAAMAPAYGQAAPSPQLAPPPPGVLANARAAAQKGADPAQVRARLLAHGYDPRAL